MSNQKNKHGIYPYDPEKNRDFTIATCENLLKEDWVKANPDYQTMFLNTLGYAHLAKGDFAQAAKCYVKTLEIDPFDTQAEWGIRQVKEKDPAVRQGLQILSLEAA